MLKINLLKYVEIYYIMSNREAKTSMGRKLMSMQQIGSKETAGGKNRIVSLLGRIFSGALLILLIGFLMYAVLVAIMYFI